MMVLFALTTLVVCPAYIAGLVALFDLVLRLHVGPVRMLLVPFAGARARHAYI